MSRLSAFGSISFPTRLGNTLGSRLHILIHCRLGNQSESSTLGKNEHYVNRVVNHHNRALRHPSRQPRALRHTRELSAPGRPFSALGSSRLALSYLNTCGSSTPPHLISSHSYYSCLHMGRSNFFYFYRRRGDENRLKLNWDDAFGGPSFVFARKAYVDETIFQKLTILRNCKVENDGSQSYRHSKCQCMLSGFCRLRERDSGTSRFSLRQKRPLSLEIWSCFFSNESDQFFKMKASIRQVSRRFMQKKRLFCSLQYCVWSTGMLYSKFST